MTRGGGLEVWRGGLGRKWEKAGGQKTKIFMMAQRKGWGGGGVKSLWLGSYIMTQQQGERQEGKTTPCECPGGLFLLAWGQQYHRPLRQINMSCMPVP